MKKEKERKAVYLTQEEMLVIEKLLNKAPQISSSIDGAIYRSARRAITEVMN